jgi:hypothetical protein
MIRVTHTCLLVEADHLASMHGVHLVIHQDGMHAKMVRIVKILIVPVIIRLVEQIHAPKVINARISNVIFYILLHAWANAMREINVVNGIVQHFIQKTAQNLVFTRNIVTISIVFVYIHLIDDCVRAEWNALNLPVN